MSKNREFVVKMALKVLREEIKEIKNVKQWALLVGYSRAWLGKCIKDCLGIPPKVVLKKFRYVKIISIVSKYPDATSTYTAEKSGLNDEKALYQFLNYHYNTTYTELRMKVIEYKNR